MQIKRDRMFPSNTDDTPGSSSLGGRLMNFLGSISVTTPDERHEGKVLKDDAGIAKTIPTSSHIKSLTYQNFLSTMNDRRVNEVVKRIKLYVKTSLAKGELLDKNVVKEFLSQTLKEIQSTTLWTEMDDDMKLNTRYGIEKYLLSRIFRIVYRPQNEMDAELCQKMAFLSKNVSLSILGIDPNVLKNNQTSWKVAQTQICNMDTFKAPRDKLICLVNCCRVLKTLLSSAGAISSTSTADIGPEIFMKALCYVLWESEITTLYSNSKYLLDFINPSTMVVESGQCLIYLCGCMSLLESTPLLESDWNVERFQLNFNVALKVVVKSLKIVVEKETEINLLTIKECNLSEGSLQSAFNGDRHPNNRSNSKANINFEEELFKSETTQHAVDPGATSGVSTIIEPDDLMNISSIESINNNNNNNYITSAENVSRKASSQEITVNGEVNHLSSDNSNSSKVFVSEVAEKDIIVEELPLLYPNIQHKDKWNSWKEDRYRFVSMISEQLRVQDVPVLLQEYKYLAASVESLLSERSALLRDANNLLTSVQQNHITIKK